MNAEPQHSCLIGAVRRAEVWEIREFPAKPPGCEIRSMSASELHGVKAFTHRMHFFCLMSNLHKQLNLNFELMIGHEYFHTECDHRREKVSSHCVIFQLEEDFFPPAFAPQKQTHHPVTVTTRKLTSRPFLTMTWTTVAIRLLFRQPYRQHMAKYLQTAGLVIGSCLLCLLRWGASFCKSASNCPADALKYYPKLASEQFQLFEEEVKLSQNLIGTLSKPSGHFVFCILMLQIHVAVNLSFDFSVSRANVWIFRCVKAFNPWSAAVVSLGRSTDPMLSLLLLFFFFYLNELHNRITWSDYAQGICNEMENATISPGAWLNALTVLML